MSVREYITVPMSRNRRLEVELLPSGFVKVTYTHEHKAPRTSSRWVTDETVAKSLHDALRGAFNRESMSKEMWEIVHYVRASRLGERIT